MSYVYIYIYIYIHTFTHTYIYIYIYVDTRVCNVDIYVYTHHAESSTQHLVQSAYAISIDRIDARSINHTIY